jgi:hypothetical protein
MFTFCTFTVYVQLRVNSMRTTGIYERRKHEAELVYLNKIVQ